MITTEDLVPIRPTSYGPSSRVKEKTCTKCGETKSLDGFPNDRSRPSGKFPRCKACNVRNVADWRIAEPDKYRALTKVTNHKPRTLERKREWEKQRKATLKRLYGIDGDDYRRMLEEQGFCCAICGRHKDEFVREMSVDHCHETGKVRALLCLNCNTGVGNLKDDPVLLRKAADYLEKHQP